MGLMMKAVSDEKDRPEKSLKDRARELVEDVLEALEDLLPLPEPRLVPIPAPSRPRRR